MGVKYGIVTGVVVTDAATCLCYQTQYRMSTLESHTSDVTKMVGRDVCVTVLVNVGVGTERQLHAKEMAAGARPFTQEGVGTLVLELIVGLRVVDEVVAWLDIVAIFVLVVVTTDMGRFRF